MVGDEGDRKTVLRKALEAIDSLQARLDAVKKEGSEPIAIVGLSCRFPGSQDPEAFWRLMREGRDAVKKVPEDRWDVDVYFGPDLSAPGKIHAPYGGFLDRIDLFDAEFFGISNREAEGMDPQQRLLLEVTWEALENAGIAADSLRGSATGVFVGITTCEYARLSIANESTSLDAYTATGSALNVAAGRIAYVLGLNGPAMAVDTACSSSLVAVHLACQSLRAGECDLALTGGVNVLLTPEPFICFAKWGMMAGDGRCKTFDERADGFVRAEGCGIVALKRLRDAVAAGDRILALIRGTAVNQDGASSGLTVPNGLAQQKVIRAALKAAGLTPNEVDYVEAHGTGTALGDPIELEALAAVLGKDRSTEHRLRVGSVKTNIGHPESAAGIAGLIKVVLSLQHEEVPGQLHFQKLNPRISLGSAAIEVQAESQPWPRSKRARIAGVSSFGFSGTNAHAVLQEAPQTDSSAASLTLDRTAHLLVLSAESEVGLRELAKAYDEHFAKQPECCLADVCHTAAVGRAPLSHRLSFPAVDVYTAREQLAAFLEGQPKLGARHGRARSAPKVAFLFNGQGSQQLGMGRILYEAEPVFRGAFDRCADGLRKYLEHPLQEMVGYSQQSPKHAGSLNETCYAQPALFAFEYALSSLWSSWGIEPAAILGHSLGEYVGACVAGVLRLEDSLRLVAVRSRLMQALTERGVMAAVSADENLVRAKIARHSSSVSIAAINSPQNTVISGRRDDIRAVLEELRREGVAAKQLPVSHAFHSPLVEPMLCEFNGCAQTIQYQTPAIDLVLNVTGRLADQSSRIDASYWCQHTRQTVRFAESIQRLHARGIRAFLEIGPKSVLTGLGRQCIDDSDTTWLASLNGQDDWLQMLSSLGALFALGANPNWNAFDRPYPRRRVALPTYPFQRKRHWLPSPSGVSRSKQTRSAGHPLLGTHLQLAGRPGEHVWLGQISLELFPWIDDHRVQGIAVLPATAYIEMVIAAAIETVSELPVVLTQIKIEKSLQVQPATVVEIQTQLVCQDQDVGFRIYSRPRDAEGEWTLNTTGTLRIGQIAIPEISLEAGQKDAIEKRSTNYFDGAEFYRLHEERGNQWGPRFKGIKKVWQGDGEALAELTIPEGIEHDLGHYIFHPALTDATGHILTATIPLEKSGDQLGGAFVGVGIDEARVYRRLTGGRFYAYAKARRDQATSGNILTGDIRVFDLSGNLVTETIGTRLWYLDSAQKHEVLESVQDWFYEPRWVLAEKFPNSSDAAATNGTWIVFRDRHGIGDAFCEQLKQSGGQCLCVDYGGSLSELTDGSITIEPEEAAGYEALLCTAKRLGSPVKGIVHLWSLDAVDCEQADVEAVRQAQTLSLISVLRLVQVLNSARPPSAPKLWLVTRGAQPAGKNRAPLALLQSPLWGLGRTVAIESGDVWGGQVDLDPADSPGTAARLLLRQVAAGGNEDQTAFRAGCRYGLRLIQREQIRSEFRPISILPDANYLITGGLGGIGLTIARWLVNRGARHLILAGRNRSPLRQDRKGVFDGEIEDPRVITIRELESRGANIRTETVDMGNEVSVRDLMNLCLAPDQAPLRGVFHAAGVMQYEPLIEQTPDQLRDILAAKMIGGWLLHRLLASAPLDLFVLFSSSSALLSSPLMGAYSAANVFLDALAHHRRAIGQPALSVNWGTWAEVGMATRFQALEGAKLHGRIGATKGVSALSSRNALEALEWLLKEEAVQVGVMPIDWSAWKQFYGTLVVAPYLSLLTSGTGSARSSYQIDNKIRERILGAQPEKRGDVLSTYLANVIARILKLQPTAVDLEKPISNLGFDSLMSIELKNQIDVDLGVNVAMARLIQGPTLHELTGWITELLASAQPIDVSVTVDAAINEFEEGEL